MSSVGSTLGPDRRDRGSPSGSSGLSSVAPHAGFFPAIIQAGAGSSCVDPDHRELIRSVGTVLHRRVRDNESAETKVMHALFCEDTHTTPVPEARFELTLPLLHLQMLSFPTLFTLHKLPPPERPPRSYPVPTARTVATFLENIRQKARLTPQALVITLIYIARLEARSEGVLLHARSWRPIVFASLLLASKVWHDISYWNSDFQSICPMFHVRNINKMERHLLQLLQYNTIISASQYAQYYFSLRHAVRMPAPSRTPVEDTSEASNEASPSEGSPGSGSNDDSMHGGNLLAGDPATDNFRSKYFMAIAVAGSSRLQEQSAAVANQQQAGSSWPSSMDSLAGDFTATGGRCSASASADSVSGGAPEIAPQTLTLQKPVPVKPRPGDDDDDDDDWSSRLFARGGMASSL